ncbi:hypothetical protein [Agromyces salentinus]|uniref:DUF4175 domain-containing protein n=1 Tax=Agromyces salentinus TaxID=269421 RepID=A0ABN2MGC7_9MICO|nr:hypothetical protein [Agromyces salentinus]
MKTVRVWLGIVIGVLFLIAGAWFLIVDVADYRGWALLGVAVLNGVILWAFLKDKDPDQSWRL